MKLSEYVLKDWKERKIKKRIKIKSNVLILLSLDRTVLPPMEGRKNLLLIDKEENIIWIAELPTNVYDSYVFVNYHRGILNAHSSNAVSVNIDIENGKIISKTLSY